ncbi:MAG: UDP-glucose--hexose-1-phosphate uridylyltransferase [Bacilli bacterium]|jgi:UDPglucose--hexose-1-phosphate uridylyltransferase|nr:UDP-glucose--hexose-1-phosphate uridylyltransferase [Bacilli bacterium]
MTPSEIIYSLVNYGEEKGLLDPLDRIYAINKLLRLFREDSYEEPKNSFSIEEAVQAGIGLGKEKKLTELENLNEEDAFEGEMIDALLPRPSQVKEIFFKKYQESPKAATDWFYQFSINARYVRTDRLKKNIVYKVKGEKIDLDITINLSRPEKDPKEIAKAQQVKSSSYPLCLLCKENEGYYGTFTHPGRANHRIIPLKLNGEDFYLQYSPYGYFNEHCIVLKKEHSPMTMNEKTFKRITDFLEMFPTYMLGSNAELPIVGGSILTHEHYQGGDYLFPLAKAGEEESFTFKKFPLIKAAIVKWPLSVLRVTSSSKEEIVAFCTYVLDKWRNYSDESLGIIAKDEVIHNTVSPIGRRVNGAYQFDLALRNNRTSTEYPLGIFHSHPEYWHIKKENIGLIEVLGLAILPGRLQKELELCRLQLLKPSTDIDPSIEKHLPWLMEVKAKHPELNEKNAEAILKEEVGLVFEKVLSDAGVFKRDEKGKAGFIRFIKTL